MENDTYEQVTLKDEDLGEQALYLMDNMEITVQYLKDKPIGIEVPTFVEMAVVETEPGAKGDTVTNVLKPAKFESGLAVQVPLFINQGDVIKIDTRTGEYVTRISKA
jgi:elongation factor P